MNDRLAALSGAGVSIWLDDLSRERLVSGSLADLAARDYVVGVTTNPSIFAKAITGAEAYHPQLRDLSARGVDAREALRSLTTFDVRWACDVLRPVYDATDGVDGRVSIEVDPRIAHDTEATIAEARALWWLVDRPNLFIKIPADHGQVPADSIHGHYEESEQLFDQLRGLGIDYDDVVQTLEDDGVAAFDSAWERLGEELATTLRAQPARH